MTTVNLTRPQMIEAVKGVMFEQIRADHPELNNEQILTEVRHGLNHETDAGLRKLFETAYAAKQITDEDIREVLRVEVLSKVAIRDAAAQDEEYQHFLNACRVLHITSIDSNFVEGNEKFAHYTNFSWKNIEGILAALKSGEVVCNFHRNPADEQLWQQTLDQADKAEAHRLAEKIADFKNWKTNIGGREVFDGQARDYHVRDLERLGVAVLQQKLRVIEENRRLRSLDPSELRQQAKAELNVAAAAQQEFQAGFRGVADRSLPAKYTKSVLARISLARKDSADYQEFEQILKKYGSKVVNARFQGRD